MLFADERMVQVLARGEKKRTKKKMCAPVSAYAELENMKNPTSYEDAVHKNNLCFIKSAFVYKYR